jgi:heme/copper-type cytochrome/quinol oxidase subunit 2
MFASLMSDTQTALSGHNIIYYFIYIVGGIILLLTIKKIYFYVRYRRRYFIFPKINTTGISNTAMVISISVTIILLLTVLSAGAMGIFFRVYPG